MNILIWGIYLVVFCLPLYLVRFKIFSIPTNALEVIIGVLFIVWLIREFKFKEFKKLFIAHRSLFIAVILIIVGLTISTIFSWDLRASAGIWKSWFIVPLLFFIIVISAFGKKNTKNLLCVFLLSASIVAVISLVYLIQGNLDDQGRLRGFYDSPNYLAMYLAPALILSLGLFFTKKKRFLKALLITNYLLLITILFFTKSIGAWLGIIAGLSFGLFLYLQNLNRKKLAWIIIVLGIMLILTLVYLKGFVLPEGGRSFDARFVIWQKALEVFKTYPIIGIGPGTFEDYFPLYPKWGVPQPHNLYLAFLLQTGLVGFVGFIWLLVWFFKKGFELLKTQNLLSITLMPVMAYILIHGLVDTTYWKNDLSIIFWLIIALLNITNH